MQFFHFIPYMQEVRTCSAWIVWSCSGCQNVSALLKLDSIIQQNYYFVVSYLQVELYVFSFIVPLSVSGGQFQHFAALFRASPSHAWTEIRAGGVYRRRRVTSQNFSSFPRSFDVSQFFTFYKGQRFAF